ncbi:hypothetical protein AFCA_011086 [Aspergillus flavus]|uniref:AAA+ ATPase domain-containing protein n=1 Tax=Aspergillus flavus TaxID=5059 RepID=A0AB74CRL9_ASPFL|nr:hypothetical protein COH20_001995 [Aspergillus flavus]RAQ76821.1 hypothetical protein COH21_008669 [Aspergillus flavus]RMZ48030.1 hypothetical protein CA14_008465 [Aspergillus flavus]UDD63832.1 hypothetical protein AFCA_011086 [Aspergillus flavus]
MDSPPALEQLPDESSLQLKPPEDEVGRMDFRAMSALPDLAEIAAFPSGEAYSSSTSFVPHTTLPQLLEAHFLRLRNTLLLGLRWEFEAVQLLNSSIGALSIGLAQSELHFEHLPSHGEGEGVGGQGTRANVMAVEAGDDGTPDGEPAVGDGMDNPDDDNWEDMSDDDRSVFRFGQQLYQNHLCFVVSNGRVLAIGKNPKVDHDLEHWEVYVPATSPSNINYRVQRLMNQIQLDSIKYLRLAAPTWRVLPILEALQKRDRLPLSEELISYSLDPPLPLVPLALGSLLKVLQNNYTSAYDMLGLGSKFRKTRISERSGIRACIPAFAQRVALYKRKAGTNTFPLSEIIIESFHKFSDQKILVILPSNSDLSDLRASLRLMGIPKKAVHRVSHLSDVTNPLWLPHIGCLSSIEEYQEYNRLLQDIEHCAKTILSQTREWMKSPSKPAESTDETPSSKGDVPTAIHRSCREKLSILLRKEDDFYESRVHPLLEHRMRLSGILDARIYLCTAEYLSVQLPQLAYLQPETVLVHGADQIDEAFLLAALPSTTTRLILFGDEESEQVACQNYQSMWSRLSSAGLPCVEVPVQVASDLFDAHSDSDSSETSSIAAEIDDEKGEMGVEAPAIIASALAVADPVSDSMECSTTQAEPPGDVKMGNDGDALNTATGMSTSNTQEKEIQAPIKLVPPSGEDTVPTRPVPSLQELMRKILDDASDDSDDSSDDSDDSSDDSDDRGDDTDNDNDHDDTIPRLESIDAWQVLEQMVGLDDIKEHVRLLHRRAVDNLSRKEAGLTPRSIPPTGIFLGRPGTGKTTVAILYAQILCCLGFVRRGSVLTINAAHFVDYREAQRVLGRSKRKVVIIDNAHALWGGSEAETDSDHRTAIELLIAGVSDQDPSRRIILLTGYEDQMVEMFQHVNPGLSRRFPLASAFRFPSFSLSQLEQILDNRLQAASMRASPNAKSAALTVLRHAMVSPQFGNAAEVDTLLHNAYFSLEKRCMNDPFADTKLLEAQDFSNGPPAEIVVHGPDDVAKVSDRLVNAEKECQMLFRDVVGNDSIISELLEDIHIVRKAMTRKLNPQDYIPFNYVFRGAPGTGKTTTARKMGQLFYNMGLLASDEVVECSVSDLIGEYVGHTGPKVLRLFTRAVGKVLFVDEAYRLHWGSASSHSFSPEALAEIVGALTSPRFQQKMVIILAGYSQGMDRLIESNPGLQSRFQRTMTFQSLDTQQCAQLLMQLMQKQGLDTSTLVGADLSSLFGVLARLKGWGNARDVHTLSTHIFRKALLSADDAETTLVVTMDQVQSALQEMITSRGGRLPAPLPPKSSPPGWNGREWLERHGYKGRT